jgi:Arc/MetJ-type ribon-helix-helix transcriptional regulator
MSPDFCREGRRILSAARQEVEGVHARRLQRIIDTFGMYVHAAEFVRAAYRAMDERTEARRREALKKHESFEDFWGKRDLGAICSPNIQGRIGRIEKGVRSLDLGAGPAHRKGYEDPSREDRLEALYSLVGVPDEVPDLHFLPSVWKFKPDLEREAVERGWCDPEFDDSDWREMSVYNFLERQGYSRYDGAYVYRVRFDAPEFPAGKRIMMRVGSLDDEGTIYINGRKAYRRHHIAPKDWKRSFAFDATDFIRPGRENVVVVVGNDEYGMGGLWNPCAISPE